MLFKFGNICHQPRAGTPPANFGRWPEPLWPHLGGSPGLVSARGTAVFKASVYSPFSDVTIIMKDGKL